MNQLIFEICSLGKEQEIASWAEKQQDFYRQHNIVFTLPKLSVEAEYQDDQNKYKSFLDSLEIRWATEELFLERLLNFYQVIDRQFVVKITNYGALGFYNAPISTIFINLNTPLDPIRTIKHELIHIMVQPFIDKYSIQHEQKEKIVNALLEVLA